MIEVGEYIRTKGGLIFKATEYWSRELTEKIKENIKSHSKNIIALVEVGDYINGERVTYKGKTKTGRTQIITEDSTDFFLKYECIETILTHEMYEQNCYKIGE